MGEGVSKVKGLKEKEFKHKAELKFPQGKGERGCKPENLLLWEGCRYFSITTHQ